MQTGIAISEDARDRHLKLRTAMPYPCKRPTWSRPCVADRRGPTGEQRLPAEGEQRTVAIDQLASEPLNPRRDFGDEELAELANSIRTKGLLQPIIVRPDAEPRRLRDRRRRAALARGADAPACTGPGDRP